MPLSKTVTLFSHDLVVEALHVVSMDLLSSWIGGVLLLPDDCGWLVAE